VAIFFGPKEQNPQVLFICTYFSSSTNMMYSFFLDFLNFNNQKFYFFLQVELLTLYKVYEK
jgi:hypothetical protein